MRTSFDVNPWWLMAGGTWHDLPKQRTWREVEHRPPKTSERRIHVVTRTLARDSVSSLFLEDWR